MTAPTEPADEQRPAEGAGATMAGTTAETAAEAQKRRFREALDRKRGAQHPADEVLRGKDLRGRGGDTSRHDFRRKSG